MWKPGVIMAARSTKYHDRFNSEPCGVSTETAIDQVFFGGSSVSWLLSAMRFCFSRCAWTSSSEAQP